METTAELRADDWGTVIPFGGFRLDKPQVWERYGSEWVEYPDTDNDVYLTMKQYGVSRVGVPNELAPDVIALMTTGYAAPIDECQDPDTGETTTPPSECDNRRRVALAVFIARDASRCTVLRFADNQGETIKERQGIGALSEALDLAALSAWGSEYLARLTILAIDEDNDLTDYQRNETRQRVERLLASAELLAGGELPD